MTTAEETPTNTDTLTAVILRMMYFDHQAETPEKDISNKEYTISVVRGSPDTTTSSIW
jgi:hypothetical protein